MKKILVFFLASRIALYVFAFLAFVVVTDRLLPLHETFLASWWRWDTVHLVQIAEHGYVTTGDERHNIAFLPLYPLLIFLVSRLGMHPVLAGLLISNLASVVVVIYLYKLLRLDFAADISQRAVFFLLMFPTAYFLAAAYTEALFFALVLAGFYFARKEQWIAASLLGMLASLTRIVGILLVIVFALEYLQQKKFQWRNVRADAASLLLIPAGFALIYLGINYVVYGNWLAFLAEQKAFWSKYLTFPWQGLVGAWHGFWWRPPSEIIMVSLMEMLFAGIGLAVAVKAFFLRLSYGAYALASWLLGVSTNFWLSLPRYVLLLFPLYVWLSIWAKNTERQMVVVFGSMLLLGLFVTQFTLGRWAF